jgi:hypothetical protein
LRRTVRRLRESGCPTGSGGQALRRALLTFLAAAGLLALGTRNSGAEPEQRRPFTTSFACGVRLFDKDLGLEEDLSLGGRIGLGLSPRWSVLFDLVVSHPLRTASGQTSAIDALRALARANIILGKIRPYAIAGVGGILFDFGDAPSSGRGALTLGLGVDVRVARSVFAFVEGSADGYQTGSVAYTPTGQPYLESPRETQILGTIALGIGAEF